MLQRLFENRTAVLLLTAMLVVAGIVLVTQLPVQLYPQTQRPRVRVGIDHEGYSSLDFYRRFGEDIEARFLAIEGIDLLQASYSNDESNFTLTFDWDVDSDQAKADAENAMTTINSTLPADIQDDYFVRFFSGENAGYLMVGVSAASAAPEELYTILKTSIEPQLKRIPDAEVVEIFNVEDLTAEIRLRQDDMLAYGVTISDVDAAMRAGYLPDPLGNLAEGDRRYSVRYSRGVQSIYDLGRMVVTDREGVIVTLNDVADVEVKYDLPRETFVMDGERGIRITATPVDGGNIRKLSEDVRGVLAAARDQGVLPADTRIVPYLDPADYINRSIRNIVESGLMGGALAMIIVLLMLGEIRNTLLVAISIPTSTILSFLMMRAFGITLNLISLGGLALAVGMVVDATVVVVENINRHRMDEPPGDNKRLRDLIIGATGQVTWAVIGSTLTTIIVFFPISLTAPLTNAILGDQARTVIFTLTFSMFVALWIIPLIAFLVYRVRPGRRAPEEGRAGPELRGLQRLSVPVMRAAVTVYKILLRSLLARRWAVGTVIAACLGLLVFSIVKVLPRIPKEIIAPPSSDRVVLFFRSATRMETEDVLRDKVPEIKRLVTERIGPMIETTYAEVRGSFNRFFVDLKDSRLADEALAELQRLFVSDNLWYYNAMKWDPAQLPLPRTMDLQISVQGEDPAELVATLERLRDLVNESELYGFAFTEPSTNLSDQVILTPRRHTIEGFPGFTEAGLTSLVRRVLRGTASVEFEEGASKIEVIAEYPEEAINERDKLVDFLVPYNQSAVPLKHFFDFSQATGVAGLASEDGERIFRLYAKMAPTEPAANRLIYEQRIKDLIRDRLPLRQGYSVVFENPQVELDEAINSLYVSLAAAIALVYVYLVYQFKSLKIPLIILVTIPLGAIGVIFSLYVFKSNLSLNSLLGMILLAGTAVNNAIVMIDFYLQILPKAPTRLDALVETAGLRFTPIMITSITASIGMLPIALGIGEGANIVQPLGIAVSGGLLVSTVFTLFVVPSIMSLMDLRPKEA